MKRNKEPEWQRTARGYPLARVAAPHTARDYSLARVAAPHTARDYSLPAVRFADLKPEWQRHIVAAPEERRQHHLRQQVRLRGPRATRLAEAKARDYSLARVAPASCACDVPVSPCRAAEKCQQGDYSSNDSTRDVHDVAMLVTKAAPTSTRDVELF